MRRRQVVAAMGLLAAGSAGCSNTPKPTFSPPTGTPPPAAGNGSTPAPGLEVTTFATRAGEGGDLVVDMTVSNPTGRARRGSVGVTATVGDTEHSATRTVDLGPDDRRDLSVTIAVPYTEWESGDGSLDFAIESA